MNTPLRALPLALIISYLLFTIGLFCFGPLPWPVTNPEALSIFLTAVLTGICIFYLIGARGEPAGPPINYWRQMIMAGAALSVILIFPSCKYYADKMPWQLIDALRDQNAVYQGLQAKLAATSGQRTLISITRALSYPFIFAALPLAILNWRRMTWILWVMVLITILTNIIFSILRGTDREMFDFIMILAVCGLIVVSRSCVAKKLPLARVLITRKIGFGLATFLVMGAVAFSAFAERRVERAGYTPEAYASGSRDAPSLSEHLHRRPQAWFDSMCIRTICLDAEHPLVSHVDVPKKYTILALTSYLTQGWYGLSLTMKQDFHSTLGIGHSPVIARLYERLTGSTSLYERGYTYGLRKLDWHDESQWSTIFPWLANDIGFPGAVAVICLVAFLFGRTWRDAIGSGNDAAAISFCLLFQLFAYVPANNQLAQTFDGYFAIVGWLSIWLFGKLKFNRRKAWEGFSDSN